MEEALHRRNARSVEASPADRSDREEGRSSHLQPPPEGSPSEHWSSTIRRRVAEGAPDEAPEGQSGAGDEETAGETDSTEALTAEIRERVERRLKETEERRSTPPAAARNVRAPARAGFPHAGAASPEAPQRSPVISDPPEWSAGWAEDEEETRPRPQEPPAAPPSRLAAFIATCAFIGRIRLAPGTIGSLAGLLAFVLTRNLPGTVSLGLFALALVVGSWAAARHAKDLRHPDPPSVVVDEFCGMWLALLGTSPSILVGAIAFVAFRFLDIAKPPPIRQLERLPGGFGIMADDLVAGGVVRVGILLTLGM